MNATPQEVRQWSEEVARDPGSLAFLPLARAYRAQGRRDAALRLCLRALERHPDHVDGHHLLGLLYREGDDLVRAFDEWDIALRLSPEHAGARREIGLLCAERGEWAAAARHLERLEAAGHADDAVAGALADARVRLGTGGAAGSGRAAAGAPAPAPARAEAPAATQGTVPADAPSPDADAAADARTPAWAALREEFRGLGAERGVVGAVLLDDQGFVLAGEMVVEGKDRAPEVAAVLSGASSEAERAVRHLGLGTWRGILLETPDATVRLAPVAEGGMLAVAARREVPTGWVLRVAGRAAEAARRWLGAGGEKE